MQTTWRLQRHSSSWTHQLAVQKLLRQSVSGLIDHVSPDADEFKQLFDRIHKGTLGVLSRKDNQKMWCLQEAIKVLDQATLQQAVTIFLFRDERDSRLLVRFGAVGPDL